ncbi:MAG TPA: phosphoribosylformylglycinamidine synthase subunit PurS [Verrucomicrobiae bacterium]|nr:phosphoribosylformylglycinamidine synthase subunit PurS [Verrucomicrobiae bacterium]
MMNELNEENNNNIFIAIVTIENKSFLNDPEGETILNDLILKSGYFDVKSIRTAKSLKIELMAKNMDDAKIKIKKMCDDLRIYNPIVSDCKIMVKRNR